MTDILHLIMLTYLEASIDMSYTNDKSPFPSHFLLPLIESQVFLRPSIGLNGIKFVRVNKGIHHIQTVTAFLNNPFGGITPTFSCDRF
jgi:hypothetical protein